MSSPYVPWMETAAKLIGVKEVRGSRNNPMLLRWAQIVGGWTAAYYKRDSIPWCGLFVAYVLIQNAIRPSPEALRAKAWKSNWPAGKAISQPAFGCIIVFTRKGGGHVGFYVSEDKHYYHVLGGNQSDAVNIQKISKKRCIGFMWPKDKAYDKFYHPGRIYKSFSGKVSVNEA